MGVWPNIARKSITTCGEMTGYDATKELVRNNTNWESENTTMYLFYGLSAGILSQMMANPADVIKTRMMNDATKYGTSFNCAKVLVKQDGILGFYKGIAPALCRACSFNIVFFFGYGWLKNFFARY